MRKTKRGEPKKKNKREKNFLSRLPERKKKKKKRSREHIRRHKCISAETKYTTKLSQY